VQGVSSVYCNVGTKENSLTDGPNLSHFEKGNRMSSFYSYMTVMWLCITQKLSIVFLSVTYWNDKILALWIHGASRLNKSIKLRNLHCLVDAKTKGYVYTH